MHQNQVYVIQVNTKSKSPLALPPPPGVLLPSEVKYSASLVRGLGCTHIVLGVVLFLLGVLGSWVEPETCWSGAGVWGGIATICCGVSGLFAYYLWYKNYTIKAFLVSSVVCVVISILAIILTIYALVNRQEHYYYLQKQAEKQPWLKSYNPDQETQQLTLSVSANQLVGFILELILALWSVHIGWKGVRAEEFSTSKRDAPPDDLQSVVSMSHNQQVPLAALYQLLQTHPELLGSKSNGGGLGAPWLSSLEDRPSHRSMDYQERVSRFLSHAIEDQNTSFSRSPSTLQEDMQDNSSPTRSSSTTGSGGRGSPSSGSADTAVMLPVPSPSNTTKGKETAASEELKNRTATSKEPNQMKNAQHIAKTHTTTLRNEAEPKSKAPFPKDAKQTKGKDQKIESTIHQPVAVAVVVETQENTNKITEETKEQQNPKEKSNEETKEQQNPKKKSNEETKEQQNPKKKSNEETKEQQNPKKKSKEKKNSSREKAEKNHSQPKDECDKVSTNSTDQRNQSEKVEKSKTSKIEKLRQITEEEERDDSKKLDILSKDKEHAKEGKSKKSNRNSSEATEHGVQDSSKIVKKERGTKTDNSERKKTVTDPNEVTEKSKMNKNTNEPVEQSSKGVTEQVIDIKPPSEFQDNESNVPSQPKEEELTEKQNS